MYRKSSTCVKLTQVGKTLKQSYINAWKSSISKTGGGYRYPLYLSTHPSVHVCANFHGACWHISSVFQGHKGLVSDEI